MHRPVRAAALGAAVIVMAATLPASTSTAAPVDYGPGVAVLEQWYEAAPRGDLAAETALIDAAKTKARRTIKADGVTLQGAARVAFAVRTPSGASAYVVQYATDTRGGQTSVAQGVSLPVGVAIWFDRSAEIVKASDDWPTSAAESGTTPQDASLSVGMWTSKRQRHLVLFDSGFPTHLREGVLGPKQSSPNDLVRIAPRVPVDFGSDGFRLVTPADQILRGTAKLSISQPDGLSNSPNLLGGPLTWLNFANDRDVANLDLDFESLQSTTPLQVRPWPAAYESGRRATKLARQWTLQRISIKTGLYGSPLQARLPGGARVLLRNVVWAKAYVALVRFPSGTVVGARCKTPGPILTASCRLPRHLGRLFTVDEPFSWKDGGRVWTAAGLTRHLNGNYAAIAPPGSVIRVEPRHGKTFVLYR